MSGFHFARERWTFRDYRKFNGDDYKQGHMFWVAKRLRQLAAFNERMTGFAAPKRYRWMVIRSREGLVITGRKYDTPTYS